MCPFFLCYSGVESPTHEIRADAAPSACSAKSIIITLANRHTFDRPVEILIHPSGIVRQAGPPGMPWDGGGADPVQHRHRSSDQPGRGWGEERRLTFGLLGNLAVAAESRVS